MTATDRLYASLTRRLRALGSPARAEKEKSYQKSVWQHWGVTLPWTRDGDPERMLDRAASLA